MISELRIAPGPVGEFAAPHLEEGSTDRQRERCRFLRQGRGTGIRLLLRSCSEIVFPPSPLPSPKSDLFVQVSGSLWLSLLLVLGLGEVWESELRV